MHWRRASGRGLLLPAVCGARDCGATRGAVNWRLIAGDLRAGALDELDDESFDAVLCDPPYGLSPDGRARTWDDLEGDGGRGFMGKAWDAAVPGATFWRTVLRVLRPGAHVVAFGGTRTYHRLACAVEDAGFEVRDMLSWLYGSGFPKSHDVSKAIDAAAGAEREVVSPPTKGGFGRGNAYGDITRPAHTAPATPEAARWSGYGTALKPAHEPAVLARKPLAGTVAANALEHGCGALAIDESRIAYASDADRAAMSAGVEAIRAKGGQWEHSWANTCDLSGANPAHENGRWPANVLLDEAAAAMLDEQSGESVSTTHRRGIGMGYGSGSTGNRGVVGPSDSGGASRFFYTAKASRSEREAGCEGFNRRHVFGANGAGLVGISNTREPTSNHHPTVKPLALTTYVARLLLPPPSARPRRLLVPFSGSGSEVIGALLAGWDEVIGIEIDDEYRRIAEARIAYWVARGAPKPKVTRKAPPAPKRRAAWVQASLFDL